MTPLPPWVMPLVLVFLISTMILSFVVQSKFKKIATTYSAKSSSSKKTGAQVAKMILESNGISDVTIVKGNTSEYSDNFNPSTKIITLSASVYDSSSIAAISIASHEVGHAIQYQKEMKMIKARTALIKPMIVAKTMGAMMMQMGLLLMIFVFQMSFLWIIFLVVGTISSGMSLIFSLATLPIEYDASRKAKQNLLKLDIISSKSSEEYDGVTKVLSAASKTYLVAFLSAFAMFLYYLFLLLSVTNRN